MFYEFLFYCRELEGFMYRNQIQEFFPGHPDSIFAEEMLKYIQMESKKIPKSEKEKYKGLPWDKVDTMWEKELARAHDFIDLKMLYAICAHQIPMFTKVIPMK